MLSLVDTLTCIAISRILRGRSAFSSAIIGIEANRLVVRSDKRPAGSKEKEYDIKLKRNGVSLALAVILAATLSATPGFSVEGTPPAQTVTDTPPVAATTGENSPSSEGEAILLSMDSAKGAFGVSDRNGTGTVDAFTTYLDIQTGAVWVPAFRDDQALLAQIQQQGQVVPAASVESDSASIVVRISDYTQQEVESALARMADIIGLRGANVAFSFNPIDDAIEAVGSPAGFELLGDSVNGIRISYTVSEETLRTSTGTRFP